MNSFHLKLDDLDWQILEALQEDARLSYAELGRRIALSSPAVQERVHRLEEAGIIEGYHAKVNPRKLGFTIMSFSRLRDVAGKDIETIAELIRQCPHIIMSHQLMGEDEFLLQIVAESIEDLEHVLMTFKDYAQIVSSIVILPRVSHKIIRKSLLGFESE